MAALLGGSPFLRFDGWAALPRLWVLPCDVSSSPRVSRVVSSRASSVERCSAVPERALSRTYRYIEMHGSRTSPRGRLPFSVRWRTRPASGGGTRDRSRRRAGSPTSTPSTRGSWPSYLDTSRNTTLLFDRQEHIIINSPRRRRRRSSPRSRELAPSTHLSRPGPGSTGPWKLLARHPNATARSP